MEKWLPYDASVPYFMLVTDNFTMGVDFSTRWNYHLNETTDEVSNAVGDTALISREDCLPEEAALSQFRVT